MDFTFYQSFAVSRTFFVPPSLAYLVLVTGLSSSLLLMSLMDEVRSPFRHLHRCMGVSPPLGLTPG